MESSARHWQGVYAERSHDEVSWFEPLPAQSLELIEDAGIAAEAPIIDVGGGASRLAAELVGRGYRDVTVADISAPALEQAREVAGPAAGSITYLEADVTAGLERTYALWHDRAVFHFMVEPGRREAYLRTLGRSLEPGGTLILATFGPEGPTSCSGLPTARYGAGELAAVLGEEFELLEDTLLTHPTPSGNEQQFLYARFRRRPGRPNVPGPSR
jgi:SAM-dependent methyltransferase